MTRKEAMYRSVSFVVMMVWMMTFSGCIIHISNESAARLTKEKMEEKYHRSFIVAKVSKQTTGGPFSKTNFLIELQEKNNPENEFQASCSLDGANVRDNYGCVLYGDSVNKEVKTVLEKYRHIRTIDQRIEYALSEEDWDTFEAYKRADNVQLFCEFKLLEKSKERALKTAYDWMQDMADCHYCFMVSFVYEGESRAAICSSTDKLITREEWSEKWE